MKTILSNALLAMAAILAITGCASTEPKDGWLTVFADNRPACEVHMQEGLVKFYQSPEKTVITLVGIIGSQEQEKAKANGAKKEADSKKPKK